MGTLYSIGHGSKSIDNFIEELKHYNIQYLVDVRTKPMSKWNPQFDQLALQAELKERGIVYVYMGNVLGGMPSDVSCYTNGRIDYAKISEKQFFKDGLSRLIVANKKQLKLAIMCSEHDPAMCHRTKLIGVELQKQGIELMHIMRNHNNEVIIKPQTEVLAEVNGGENIINLFGEEKTFVSRKTYM